MNTGLGWQIIRVAYLQARRRYGYSSFLPLVALLRPLVDLTLVYWIFGRLLRIPVSEYLVYLVCGLLPWIFLSRSITAATSTYIIDRRSILNIGTPPLLLPLAAATLELGKFLIGFSVMLLVLLITSRPPTALYWLLPVALIPLIVSAYALSVAASYFAVLRRGLSHLLPFFFFACFWFTPVMYHWSLLPGWAQPIVRYNPLTLLVSGPQVILHGRSIPSLELLVGSYVVALIALVTALALHRKLQHELPARL